MGFFYHDKPTILLNTWSMHETLFVLLQYLIQIPLLRQQSLIQTNIFWTILFIPFLTHLSALHCTHFPFVWSSWVHMMLRCQASSRAAAEPNRREWGRKEERKWQTRAWGILGATKNSTERRRGEWWRVCRHNDEGNIGWVIFSCFKNEMFCSRNRKKKKLLQLSACSLSQIKQRLF